MNDKGELSVITCRKKIEPGMVTDCNSSFANELGRDLKFPPGYKPNINARCPLSSSGTKYMFAGVVLSPSKSVLDMLPQLTGAGMANKEFKENLLKSQTSWVCCGNIGFGECPYGYSPDKIRTVEQILKS